MPSNKQSVLDRLKDADDDAIEVMIKVSDLRKVILALERVENIIAIGHQVPASLEALVTRGEE